MMGRIAHMRDEILQLRHMLCPFHQGQSAIHGHTVACHLIRLAAKSGAIARRPRRRAVRKKQDILSLWTPSRTTGFAINARRHNSPDKLAIARRSEEHTSELQSLMRISYAVFCLKTKTQQH